MYAIAAIIIAIVAIMAAHMAQRACSRADLELERASIKASEAIRLASLAIARVSSSRALRLYDDLLFKKSDAHCLFCADHTPDEILDNIVSSSKGSKDLINGS